MELIKRMNAYEIRVAMLVLWGNEIDVSDASPRPCIVKNTAYYPEAEERTLTEIFHTNYREASMKQLRSTKHRDP